MNNQSQIHCSQEKRRSSFIPPPTKRYFLSSPSYLLARGTEHPHGPINPRDQDLLSSISEPNSRQLGAILLTLDQLLPRLVLIHPRIRSHDRKELGTLIKVDLVDDLRFGQLNVCRVGQLAEVPEFDLVGAESRGSEGVTILREGEGGDGSCAFRLGVTGERGDAATGEGVEDADLGV